MVIVDREGDVESFNIKEVNNIGDTKYYEYVTYGSNFYPSEGKTYYVGVRIEK